MCHAFQPCVLWMLLYFRLYSKTEMPAERSLTQPQDRSFLPIRKTDSMDHKNASFSHNWWHHGTHRVNWSRCWEIPTASILFHFWYHGLPVDYRKILLYFSCTEARLQLPFHVQTQWARRRGRFALTPRNNCITLGNCISSFASDYNYNYLVMITSPFSLI